MSEERVQGIALLVEYEQALKNTNLNIRKSKLDADIMHAVRAHLLLKVEELRRKFPPGKETVELDEVKQ